MENYSQHPGMYTNLGLGKINSLENRKIGFKRTTVCIESKSNEAIQEGCSTIILSVNPAKNVAKGDSQKIFTFELFDFVTLYSKELQKFR